MLVLYWAVFVLLCACWFVLMPLLVGREIWDHYRGARAVICPETHRQVAVRFDALHAAVTGLGGAAKIRLADCTRWPERTGCDQDCLPDALRAQPCTAGEVAPPSTKKIYHLPVFVAAFAAWLLGAVLHSQFLLRTQWREALGLSGAELRPLVAWMVPHLLTVAIPLLFAYGVAWLLALSSKKGVVQGICLSVSLWIAVAAASLAVSGLGALSRELLLIEAAYTFAASVIVGALIGSLSGRMVEQRFAGQSAESCRR